MRQGYCWLSKVFRVLLAVAAVVAFAPASVAAPADEFGIFDSKGNLLAGFYRLTIDGRQINGMCIDFEHAPADTDIPWQLAPVAAPQFAYLAATYGQTDDVTQAAALAYLAHISPELPHWDKRDPAAVLPGYRAMADAVALAEQMRADAAAHAGPYQLVLALEMAADGRSGTVAPQVLSASGTPMTDVDVYLEIEGPAAFAAGGTSQIVRTSTAPVTVQATGNGPVTVRAQAKNLIGSHVTLALPHDATAADHDVIGYQRLITTETDREQVNAAATFSSPFQLTFAPEVSTQTSSTVAQAGAQIHDKQTVSVSKGQWVGSVTVTSTLYGPLPNVPTLAEQAPPGTPVVGTVSYQADKPGTYQTDSLTLPKPGYYVWQESIAPGEFNSGWTGRFGQASETTLVRFSPKVRTMVETSHISVGEKIADWFELSDGRPGQEYTVRHTLYGPTDQPLPVGAPVPVGTPIADTVTSVVTADEKGAAAGTSPSTIITAPGYYTYTETIQADQENNGWNGTTVRAEESFLTRWSPRVSTKVSTPLAHVGQQVHDVLTVSGVAEKTETVFQVTLLRTDQPWPSGLTAPPAEAEVVAKWSVPVKGPGQVKTEPFTVTQPGSYAFWVTHDGSQHTDPFTPQVFPEPDEQFVVPFTPVVTTNVSAQRVAPGTEIIDHVQVSGAIPHSVVPVELTVWGPILDRPPVIQRLGGNHGEAGQRACTPTVKSDGQTHAAHPLATQTVEVTIGADGSGQGQSAPFVVAGPGFYTVTDALAGDGRSVCWASDFGLPDETVAVPWQVRFASEVSDHTLVPGGVVSDTIWIEGLPPNHGQLPASWPQADPDGVTPPPEAWDGVALGRHMTDLPIDFGQHPSDIGEVTIELFGPFPQHPDASTQPGQPVATVSLPARNGEQATGLFGPLHEPGWYTFQASVVDSDRVTGSRTPLGEESETFVIPKVPPEPAPETPAPPPEPPQLAETGSGWWSWPLRDTGFIMLVAGIAVVVLATRTERVRRC